MNVHERFWKTLNHEEPDRVPTFSQSIEGPFINRYDDEIEITGEFEIWGSMQFELAREIGLDSKWEHIDDKIVMPRSSIPKIEGLDLELKKGEKLGADGTIHYGGRSK